MEKAHTGAIYSYRSGQTVTIYGENQPEGTLLVSVFKNTKEEESIKARLRLAYNGKDYLVPGVPEAPNDKEAFQALSRFIDWNDECLEKQRQNAPAS